MNQLSKFLRADKYIVDKWSVLLYHNPIIFLIFQMTAFTDQTLGLLLHLMFVKQLQAMQEFFHGCQTAVNAYGL